ncbi:MAG TPA: hypothetical protein VI320_09330 [Terracidiphilus sp.]
MTEESQAMCGGGLPGAVVQQRAARPVADGPALLEVTGRWLQPWLRTRELGVRRLVVWRSGTPSFREET